LGIDVAIEAASMPAASHSGWQRTWRELRIALPALLFVIDAGAAPAAAALGALGRWGAEKAGCRS